MINYYSFIPYIRYGDNKIVNVFLTHAMKGYTGSDVQLHSFLTSPLHGGEWSASRPRHFNARVNASDIHSTEGWAAQNRYRRFRDEKKHSCPPPPCQDPNTGKSSPYYSHHTDYEPASWSLHPLWDCLSEQSNITEQAFTYPSVHPYIQMVSAGTTRQDT